MICFFDPWDYVDGEKNQLALCSMGCWFDFLKIVNQRYSNAFLELAHGAFNFGVAFVSDHDEFIT